MEPLKCLRIECIKVGSSAEDKRGILAEIARLAKKSVLLSAYREEQIFESLFAREKIGSTGFGKGIAIPHCSLDQIEEFVVGLLISKEGVDFEAIDNNPVHALFFIIGPSAQRDVHIQILSSISKLMKTPEVVDRLRNLKNEREVFAYLSDLLRYGEGVEAKEGQCLFHVFVQREDYFNEILQVFTAAVQGSLLVFDADNAGSYLYSLPLFSALWSERRATFNKIIVAVVHKGLSNDVIRRINLIADNITKEPGVLVAVQDLIYTSGSIEF
jgi:PTS system nitrogen regulatory IIA component